MTLVLRADAPLAQICGRPFSGARHLGMPSAGPADSLAHALANWLLGNGADAATLEITLAPVSALAVAPIAVALVGAAGCMVNGASADCSRPILMAAGDQIDITAPLHGCRSYLAAIGGFGAQEILGSRSALPWAGIGRALRAGDRLETQSDGQGMPDRQIDLAWLAYIRDSILLRCVEGPEFEWIDKAARNRIFGTWSADARMDRRGMALQGDKMQFGKGIDPASMPSSATFPGTVQCPPNGLPYILGQDSSTTGGYPRIAQIIRADRHLAGQIRPGTRLHLVRTTTKDARQIFSEKRAIWRSLTPDLPFG